MEVIVMEEKVVIVVTEVMEDMEVIVNMVKNNQVIKNIQVIHVVVMAIMAVMGGMEKRKINIENQVNILLMIMKMMSH